MNSSIDLNVDLPSPMESYYCFFSVLYVSVHANEQKQRVEIYERLSRTENCDLKLHKYTFSSLLQIILGVLGRF